MKKYFKPFDLKILIPITGIICWTLVFTLFSKEKHLLPLWLEIIFFISCFLALFNYVKWDKINWIKIIKSKFPFLLLLVLTSCSNDTIEVEPSKQEQVTTLEIQELAKKDTCTYKVVYLNETLYVVNKDLKVEKKLNNYTGLSNTTMIIIIILLFLLFMVKLITD